MATILESLRARQPEEESPTAAGDLGDNERAALATDGSVAAPEAGVVSNAPKSGAVKPVVLEG